MGSQQTETYSCTQSSVEVEGEGFDLSMKVGVGYCCNNGGSGVCTCGGGIVFLHFICYWRSRLSSTRSVLYLALLVSY